MSKNYDNWEKLVGAVLRRELLRHLALCNSRDSSCLTSPSSSFNLGSDDHFLLSNPGDYSLPTHYQSDWEGDDAELEFPIPQSTSSAISKVNRVSPILWHANRGDAVAVRKLLEEDPSLVQTRDYDYRTPLHMAAIRGRIDLAKCLLEFGADINAQDRWKNTPLADAEGAKGSAMIELLKSYGGLSYGQDGSHFERRTFPPPLPNKCDWEIEPAELDFLDSVRISKEAFGEIMKASWRGTPVAVKCIMRNLSEDRLVVYTFQL